MEGNKRRCTELTANAAKHPCFSPQLHFHRVSPSGLRSEGVKRKYRRLRASPLSATARSRLLARLQDAGSRSLQTVDNSGSSGNVACVGMACGNIATPYMEVTNFSIRRHVRISPFTELHAPSPAPRARYAPGYGQVYFINNDPLEVPFR